MRKELVIITVLVCLVLGCFLVGWPADFFVLSRPYWLDELHTYLLITNLEPSEFYAGLAAGLDHHPPSSYFFFYLVNELFDSPRLFSLFCVAGATILVFLTLRRSFSFFASSTAALVTLIHPLVLYHSVQARPYALLYFLTALACYLFPKKVLLPVVCLFLGLTHYFGLLIALVVSFFQDGKRRIICSLAALLSLVLTLPLYLSQRDKLIVDTWMPETTLSHVLKLLGQLYPVWLIIILLISFWFIRKQLLCEQSALLSLNLVVDALLIFSLFVQPVHLPRYFIVGILGVAPFVSLLAEKLRDKWRIVVAMFLLLASSQSIYQVRAKLRNDIRPFTEIASTISTLSTEKLVLFDRRHLMLPVVQENRELIKRSFFLDTRDISVDQITIFDSVFWDSFYQYYGVPKLLEVGDVRLKDSFILVTWSELGFAALQEFRNCKFKKHHNLVFSVDCRSN